EFPALQPCSARPCHLMFCSTLHPDSIRLWLTRASTPTLVRAALPRLVSPLRKHRLQQRWRLTALPREGHSQQRLKPTVVALHLPVLSHSSSEARKLAAQFRQLAFPLSSILRLAQYRGHKQQRRSPIRG